MYLYMKDIRYLYFVLNKGQFKDNSVSLVGSAEQSFLYLMNLGVIEPETRYIPLF